MKTLITGASEGIGREFAHQLAAQGYTITAVARNEERLKSLIAELGGAPHSYRVTDLSDPNQVNALAKELELNDYDLLVNNAGFGIYKKFYQVPIEQHLAMTRLNCDALITLAHAFLQNASAGDSVINVASTLGFVPMPIGGLYSATKAFVVSFSESLWFEQKSRGIYIMALCPGATSTQFFERAGGTAEQEPPSAITQTPKQVVEIALRALKSRSQPTVICGLPNRTLVALARIFPRKWMVSLMGMAR
jgi:short-subunit dehydrogenase